MIFHSPFEYSYLWLPLIGFVIGLLASMVGSGGGFFFLPVLILLFKMPAQMAVSTSLAATLPICIVGSVNHYRHDNINLKMGLLFIISGIIGSIAGAGLTSIVTPLQLKRGFGIYSILIAIPILVSYYRRKHIELKEIPRSGRIDIKKISKGSVYGLLAGVITGSFGTSGAAPVLAGLLSLNLPIKLVAGTSLMIVMINTISALGAHFLIGEIDLTMVYLLATGSVVGAFSGPAVLSGLKTAKAEGPVRKWYAFAMIIFGIIILFS